MSGRCLGALKNAPLRTRFICHLLVATGDKMTTSGSRMLTASLFLFSFDVASNSLSQKDHERSPQIFALSTYSNEKLTSVSRV